MFYKKVILPVVKARTLRSLLLIPVIFCFTACTKTGLYEKSVRISEQSWAYSHKPSFTFKITDTTAFYNVYVVLRHTDAYRYNNIWLRVGTKLDGDTARYQNINIILGDSKGWAGRGMDDIFEVRRNITPGPVPFSKAGTYIFTLEQIMREDPLKHVLDVGMRIEKAE